jgi:hypothetical protein
LDKLFPVHPDKEIKDMNTVSKNKVVNVKKIVVVLVALTICFTFLPGFQTEAQADKGAAFLGGMVAGRVLTGAAARSERRTRAEESQAYSQQQSSQRAAPAPAPAAKPTAESRIKQLDKLAAGGYITPEEYKTKKKAILAEM